MKFLAIALTTLSLLAAGCGDMAYEASNTNVALRESSGGTAAYNATSVSATAPQSPGRGGGGVEDAGGPDSQAAPLDPVPSDRKIIRNAELRLEADSPEEVQRRVTAIAEAKGGFVVESQQSGGDGRTGKRDTVSMTLRVPAEKFAETLDEIRREAGSVVMEHITGKDVTEEFIDIEAWLKAQLALEAQFMEIMKQANSVEQALSVQRQLADVRSDIERIEGRKRFLENQASLSTVKLRIETPAAIAASGSGFMYELREAVSDGIGAALAFVLGLIKFVIALAPFALFIGLPGYLLARYFWRKARRERLAAEIAEEEIQNG